MADNAIKQGFDLLIKRVLMKEDYSKVSNLDFSSIKELVTYYNISNNNEISDNTINFNKMIWAIYRIHYGIDFLEPSLNSIMSEVDKIFIFYSKNPWVKAKYVNYKNQNLDFPKKP